jgi:hypothetical protein
MWDDDDLEEESLTLLDKSATTILYLRRIVVRDGSIEAMTLFQQKSSYTAGVWFPESMSFESDS